MNIYGNSVGHPLPDPRKGMEMSGPINMNGQAIKGLNAPTTDDEAVNWGVAKKAIHKNLLDNSDFRNPVNQRGKEIYTAAGYTIDRWTKSIGVAMTVAVGNGKITLSKSGAIGTFVQILPFDMTGKTVTFAIKTSEGITCRSVVVSTSPAHTQIGSLHAYVDVYISNGTTIFRIYFSQTDDVTLGLYWAALYEGEYTAETLPEYHPKGYMVEALNCGALTVHKTLDIPASGWSSITPYTQTVSLEGVSAEDTAHVSPIYSETLATALAQQEAWGMVSRAKTAANAITFYCFDEKPTTDISVQIEVNR